MLQRVWDKSNENIEGNWRSKTRAYRWGRFIFSTTQWREVNGTEINQPSSRWIRRIWGIWRLEIHNSYASSSLKEIDCWYDSNRSWLAQTNTLVDTRSPLARIDPQPAFKSRRRRQATTSAVLRMQSLLRGRLRDVSWPTRTASDRAWGPCSLITT